VQPVLAPPSVLPADDWTKRAAAHEARIDAWTAPHRERRRRGEAHPVLDFLFTYYSETPGRLRRWHPGPAVALAPSPAGPAPHGTWRWYATDTQGIVDLDVPAYLADRGDTVRFVRRLLAATASRPAFSGCFGLHEWAMVHRTDETRHDVPLRLGGDATDEVVESHRIACSHFDAFRFFTPTARPMNALSPGRDDRAAYEQPGCLHATMDLYKHAFRLWPLVGSNLVADCFVLAWDVREVDMRASPYDFASWGFAPIKIETAQGKRAYAAHQRAFADRAAPLRARLVEACDLLLSAAASE